MFINSITPQIRFKLQRIILTKLHIIMIKKIVYSVTKLDIHKLPKAQVSEYK